MAAAGNGEPSLQPGTPNAPATLAPPVETIGFDLPCASCEHNLRGLPPDRRCPECGAPIAWTLQGSPLAAADAVWLARVVGGVRLLVTTLPLTWVPIVWPLFWWGLVRMTESVPASGRGWVGALLLRSLAGLLMLGASGAVVGALSNLYDDPTTPAFLGGVAGGAPVVCGGLAALGLMLLARNGNDRALRRAVRAVKLVTLVVIALLLGAAALYVAAAILPGLELIAATLSFIAGAGLLAGLPLCGFALLRVWRILDQAEVHARVERDGVRAWRGVPPPPAASAPSTSPSAPPA